MRTILQTVPATIDTDGQIRLLQPVRLEKPAKALVAIYTDEAESDESLETSIRSEHILVEDWNRPEDDATWSHLRQAR